MKLTSLLVAGAAMHFFNSCSDDDATTVPPSQEDVTFSHYTFSSITTYEDGSLSPYNYSYTGNLINGKRLSITGSDGITTPQFIYTNDLLTETQLIDVTHFFYDAAGIFIAADKTFTESNNQIFYRFVHPSPNVVYSERLTLPYNNPATAVQYRNILEFDDNQNVIKAGLDQNLDGVMDHENHFIYGNGDLLSAELWNGTSVDFQYSTVVDNFSVIDDNSYGKQLRRTTCAEVYAGNNFENNLQQSMHLRPSEVAAAAYDVLGNNYYKKKTVSLAESMGANSELTTEFFFE